MSKQKESTEKMENPRLKELQETIRLKRQTVVNIKAKIFDVIEEKSKIQNDIELMRQKVESKTQEIVKNQQVLEGERKGLLQFEQELLRDFPEITVEK